MEFVHEAVVDGGEDDADAGDEGEAAEQGVRAGEDFAGGGVERADGAHAGEDHRGVYIGVHPAHFFKVMVADHADAE